MSEVGTRLMGLCGYDDVDDLFAYSTPKIMKVRDFRLGVLDKILKLVIFLYIIIYAVALQQGYYAWEIIAGGTLTIGSQTPTPQAPDDFEYCCNPGQNTTRWGTNQCKLNPGVVAAQGNSSQTHMEHSHYILDHKMLPCAYWDGLATVYPVGLDQSIALTTRAEVTEQTAVDSTCGLPPVGGGGAQWGYGCDIKTGAQDAYYFPNIEESTLLIKHGTRGRNVDVSFSNTGQGSDRKKGYLQYQSQDDDTNDATELPISPLQTKDPNTGKVKVPLSKGDIMSAKDLLTAAGVYSSSTTALDDERPNENGEMSSIRYDGLNIVVYIKYDRSVGGEETYTYQPRQLSSVEYKVVTRETYPGIDDKVFEVNRHGIRFVFIQVGRIGKFDFQALLLTFVASVGLLAVSSTVVNMLMTSLMQFKNYYKFYKFELTDDFSALRNDQAKFEEQEEVVRNINTGKLPRSAYLKDVQAMYAKADKVNQQSSGSNVQNQQPLMINSDETLGQSQC